MSVLFCSLAIVFSYLLVNVPYFTRLLFSLQYVAKNNSELHQRAIPKRAPVLTIVDERDDSVERQVQRIPTIDPVVTETVPQPDDVTIKAQPETSTLNLPAKDVAVHNDAVCSTGVIADETPHIHVETEEAREARLDTQWKQLKLDMADLPDIYARLSKIKLTGRVHRLDGKQERWVAQIRDLLPIQKHLFCCLLMVQTEKLSKTAILIVDLALD